MGLRAENRAALIAGARVRLHLPDLYHRNQAGVQGTAAALAFLALWEVAGNLRLINPNFTSYPSRIIRRMWELFYTGTIYPHISISFQELLIGLGAAIFVGIFLGLAMGRIQWFDYLITPFVNTLYSTPRIVFLPILIIWLGLGIWSKVALVFLGAIFPVLINTYHGVKATDPSFIEAAISYGAKEKDIFFKVVLWSALPFIVAGLRLGMGRALISVVVAELYGASAGLGFLVVNGGATMDADLVFASAALFTAIGLCFNYLLRRSERKVAPWLYESHQE